MKSNNVKTLGFIVLIAWAGSLRAQSATGLADDFSKQPDATPLGGVAGWAFHYGETPAAAVSLASGYTGPGVRFAGKGQFRRDFAPVTTRGGEAGCFEFRIKVRVVADSDAYAIAQFMLGKTGGVNGFAVRFSGGTKDGWEDNTVQVSVGGASWGAAKFKDVPELRWRKGRWYEIVIAGLKTPGSAEGEAVAQVSLLELAETPKPPSAPAPIGRVGAAGTLDEVDTLIIGNVGSARAFDVDDISLKLLRR